MTEAATGTSTFRIGRFLVAEVLGLAGHALAYVAALVTARTVEPSTGGGFEDLAAAVTVFIGVELVVALVCLILGVVWLVKGSRDRGVGLLSGWLLGAVLVFVAISA